MAREYVRRVHFSLSAACARRWRAVALTFRHASCRSVCEMGVRLLRSIFAVLFAAFVLSLAFHHGGRGAFDLALAAREVVFGGDGSLDAGAVEPYSQRLRGMSVEIFSAPGPFVGEGKVRNEQAIRSWLRLIPKPKVTLLGHQIGYDEAARDFGISIERRVDNTFMRVPMFNSMIHRANNSDATISVLINGDILLNQDFMQALKRVAASFEHFLAVGARYDVDGMPEEYDARDPLSMGRIRSYVRSFGTLQGYEAMDVWAWNSDGPRLYDPVMPHFVFGRRKYENWLTHETITAGRRQVVDISETCLALRIRSEYSVQYGAHTIRSANRNLRLRSGLLLGNSSHRDASKFEHFINIYISLRTGSYTNGMGTTLHAPWKLSSCIEPSGMCLLKRKRPGLCYCESSSFVERAKADPVIVDDSLSRARCGSNPIDTKIVHELPVVVPSGRDKPRDFGLPLTLSSVLEQVVHNNTVVISALNYGYRSMMMNWVCNMRYLNLTNFVIAALDEDLYLYAQTRGLPTYFENSILKGVDEHSLNSEASYGSVLFKKVTKMKTRVVVRILKLGYNVVWTDCDIIWYRNPLEYLWGLGADLAIQSNAPDKEASNARGRINSGFYLARSNAKTITAFERVIVHATRSRKSEQPCFYDILCGTEGQNTVGTDRCQYGDVSVVLLDRSLYPNGNTKSIWKSPPGTILRHFPNLYILHNNWIVGVDSKYSRMKDHGLVLYSEEEEICECPLSW